MVTNWSTRVCWPVDLGRSRVPLCRWDQSIIIKRASKHDLAAASVSPSLCLSVCLSAWLSVSLSLSLSRSLSLCLSAYLSVGLCPSFSVSVTLCLSVSACACLSARLSLSVCSSVCSSALCFSFSVSLCLSVSLCVCPSVWHRMGRMGPRRRGRSVGRRSFAGMPSTSFVVRVGCSSTGVPYPPGAGVV